MEGGDLMKEWNKPTMTDLSTEFTKGGGTSYVHDGVWVDTQQGHAELTYPVSGIPSTNPT